jgi:RNA 2',3'-cyclic 3'-phosphodiesterase
MRLFIGLDLPDDVVENLEQLIGRLKPSGPIAWSPPSNLHVTTKFIGEWKEERLGELTTALAGVRARDPIPVSIRRVGFFPNPHSPRIFWCGVDAPGLADLARETDDATVALGIGREERAFSPHLTLARIKDARATRPALQALREAIAGLESLEFGSFTARSFFLYQSTRKAGASVYTKLAEFPLRKP